MRFILIWLLILFLSNPTISQKIYETNDFSVVIPEKWDTIPKEKLKSFEKDVKTTMGNYNINYVDGLFIKERDYFSHPYCIIQKIEQPNIDNHEFLEIARNISNEFDLAYKKIINEQLKDLITASEFEGIVIDTIQKVIYINSKMENDQIGTVKMISAWRLYSDGILIVHFYSLVNEFEKFINSFNIIDQTFKVTKPHKSNQKSSLKNSLDWGEVFGSALGKGIGAAIFFLIIYGIIWVYKSIRN